MGRCCICGALPDRSAPPGWCRVCDEVPGGNRGYNLLGYPRLTMRVYYTPLVPLAERISAMLFGVIVAHYRLKHIIWLARHHEEIHKAQVFDFRRNCESNLFRAYLRFYCTYLWQVIRYGRRNAPLELEARRYAPWPEYMAHREKEAWKFLGGRGE